MTRRLGVEEELLVVDPDTGKTLGVAGSVLRRAKAHGFDDVESELQQEQLEIATRPCETLTDLAAELANARRDAAISARECGAEVAALATSPRRVHPATSDDARYRHIVRRFGLLARELLTCGCHVHVDVGSDEEGVAVLDRIRPWLPVLTALSANSPFWQEEDTSFASYRYTVWERWPSAGPTGIFGSARSYLATVDALLRSGTILDDGMIYFNARLSRHYPTVEIRVADVCLRSTDAVLIAALARALVETAARSWHAGDPPDPIRTEVLRVAHWRAARSGLEGRLVHPLHGCPEQARTVVDDLMQHIGPALDVTGDRDTVQMLLDELWARGSGATVQRAVYRQSQSWRDLVRAAIEQSSTTG